MINFHMELVQANKNFNLETAQNLSNKIHEAESNSHQITMAEDRLWEKLTYKIQRAYRLAGV